MKGGKYRSINGTSPPSASNAGKDTWESMGYTGLFLALLHASRGFPEMQQPPIRMYQQS